jgi:PTH1 family peptidyl-tRNA hydrolase
MKLLVGLGNPGSRYADTRHNIGFMVIEQVARKFPGQHIMSDAEVDVYQTTIDRNRVLLLRPQTYMNLSGIAVQRVVEEYAIDIHDLTVIYDDLDLNVGRLRIRKKGGHGGHKGVRSIIEHLETPHFVRLRMGIGRPNATRADEADGSFADMPSGDDLFVDVAAQQSIVEYVLQPFTQAEQPIIREAVERAVDAIGLIAADQVDAAMNLYNSR